MSRRFKADFGSAANKVAQGQLSGITGIHGDSDDKIEITYSHPNLARKISIWAIAQDVSEYPDGNSFTLSTDSGNAPADVTKTLEDVQGFLFGTPIYEMIGIVSNKLGAALATSSTTLKDDRGTEMDEADKDTEETSDEEFDYDDEFDHWADESPQRLSAREDQRQQHLSASEKQSLRRLKQDAQLVRLAGYRVGALSGLGSSPRGILSISIRIDKLDLSEEALGAWRIPDTDYVVLLIRYEAGYVSLEDVMNRPAAHSGVQYRIGLCQRYKPSLAEAQEAFVDGGKTRPEPANKPEEFRGMHISASLNQFMNDTLVSLLKLRLQHKTTWDGANDLLLGRSGLSSFDDMDFEFQTPAPEEDDHDQGHHHLVSGDHLVEGEEPGQGRSFPLIAMQFAMRYFTKCTKYCLRCHRKVEEGFEALRPYVCSDPLCLFQYMALGLGPDLEQEIITQPAVVDLLVSLCYASLQSQRDVNHGIHPRFSQRPAGPYNIREFPAGLQLRVPSLFDSGGQAPDDQVSGPTPLPAGLPGFAGSAGGPVPPPILGQPGSRPLIDLDSPPPNPPKTILGHINYPHTSAVILDSHSILDRFTPRQRICLRYIDPRHQPPDIPPDHEAVVTSLNPQTRMLEFQTTESTPTYAEPYPQGRNKRDYSTLLPTAATPTAWVEIFPHDTDFDALCDNDKSAALRYLLDTLPRISDLQKYLLSRPGSKLRSYEQVSPASYALLRWIVSSNRSYIDKVSDGLVDGSEREADCIPNMKGWIQFRFSQGSPDKEIRFTKALQEVSQRIDLGQQPTIFAWHGSHVGNWHSILRSGLDFKDIRMGRAFGNGVYFSPVFSTSVGYTAGAGGDSWPNSDLQVRVVMSMNEIINVPEEFVSSTPHYVVSQPDWHQCRYLFVGVKGLRDPYSNNNHGLLDQQTKALPKPTVSKVPMLTQAPGREIKGPTNETLQLPVASMPARVLNNTGQRVATASRVIRSLEDDSEEDDPEDKQLLADDDDATSDKVLGKRTRDSSVDTMVARKSTTRRPPTPALDETLTDFRPGTLNLETLPRLEPPSWATPAATQSLSRELKKLQRVQATTPLHELGWYMDFDKINNLFQWVVELHSFESTLPFAQDMKRHGVTSIVAEIRFGKDWPLSPPFVRIIRPRFLPFIHGGGGHVTGGGAMCMELLTNTGWSPANSMESVIMQVRMALTNLEPQPARLHPGGDYGIHEAIEAYIRSANSHGWVVPPGLKATALGGGAGV